MTRRVDGIILWPLDPQAYIPGLARAQAAGFAAPSLYRYFESKEEIRVGRERDDHLAAHAHRAAPLSGL